MEKGKRTLNAKGRKQKVTTVSVDHVRGQAVCGVRRAIGNGVVLEVDLLQLSFKRRDFVVDCGLGFLQLTEFPENARGLGVACLRHWVAEGKQFSWDWSTRTPVCCVVLCWVKRRNQNWTKQNKTKPGFSILIEKYCACSAAWRCAIRRFSTLNEIDFAFFNWQRFKLRGKICSKGESGHHESVCIIFFKKIFFLNFFLVEF